MSKKNIYKPNNLSQAGFDDYFAKPVKLEILYRAARDAFEKIDLLEAR